MHDLVEHIEGVVSIQVGGGGAVFLHQCLGRPEAQ